MLFLLLVGAFVVVWVGWRGLQALGILNQVQRMRVELTVLASPVNVSIEGGDLRKADDAKLYTGDRVVTNSAGRAGLKFFDGSSAGIDQLSDVTIGTSEQGTKHSSLALSLQKGQIVWSVPSLQSFSGSISRTVVTPLYEASLPSNTRAIFTERGVQVLEADGLGVTVTVSGVDDPASIGEGQQLQLPDGAVSGSLYNYRSVIDPSAVRLAAGFDAPADAQSGSGELAGIMTGSGETIVLSSPVENLSVKTATVMVKGKVGLTVQRVRVNGYDTKIDPKDGSFTQELAVTKGATMDVLAEALDSRDVVIGQVHRTVRLQETKLGAPTITAPAAAGSVYRTQKKKFTISGTAPAGAAGIVVNDYRLQIFKEGDKSWAYLANADLGNLKEGRNDFVIYAVDSAGKPGSGATLTILLEDGAEGVVTGQTAATPSSEAAQVEEKTLPQNSPLSAGSLSVTAPTAGLPYTATGSEVLIEGKTSAQTDSIWVNGYKLRLYTAGKTYWNYYAREQYATLKKGKNTYVINARNAKGEIIDTLTYEINY